MLHAAAQRIHKVSPFDVMVSGHVHVLDDYEFKIDGKTIRSINLGSWEKDFHVGSISETGFEFVKIN